MFIGCPPALLQTGELLSTTQFETTVGSKRSSQISLTENNRTATRTAVGASTFAGVMAVTGRLAGGPWYVEFTYVALADPLSWVGLVYDSIGVEGSVYGQSGGAMLRVNGQLQVDAAGDTRTAMALNETIGFVYTSGTLKIYRNNIQDGSNYTLNSGLALYPMFSTNALGGAFKLTRKYPPPAGTTAWG